MAVQRSRQLRRNSTEPEKRLWQTLRAYQVDGFYFRRQAPMGKYVVDFICHRAKLIIEIDGGQHAFSIAADEVRTARLNREGYRVIRFWNNEVMENMAGVMREIQKELFETK